MSSGEVIDEFRVESPQQYGSRYVVCVTRSAVLMMVGAGAAAGFALVERAVAWRDTAPVDAQVHEQMAVEPGHPVGEAAEAVALVGKWWTYLPAAVLAGGYVLARRSEEGEVRSRVAGTAAIFGAACIAALVNKQFDDLLPQPPAPPGRSSPDHPVFGGYLAAITLASLSVAAYEAAS